ncbi:MAG: HAD family hydrolase [Verrucomicrobia bacterium]|nr:HAD family hydrolase [Verrucomicrobiota bacterium]
MLLKPSKPKAPRRLRAAVCRLVAPGWNAKTRGALEELIRQGAGQRLPVVFDFDNTIIHGDIGEATFGVLARSGKLTPARLPAVLAPTFHPKGKGRIALPDCGDIAEYYEALLAPTAHGDNDPSPLTTGYAWVVEIMAGLQLSEVVQATHEVSEMSQNAKPGSITVTPGKTAFAVPRFYPEMVELLAQLLRFQFEVWIVSASNVWSVRWMVLNALNPRLREYGAADGIAADHVIGAATLVADADDRLYKDSVLVHEHPGYAALEAKTVDAFRLTSRLQFPVPAYSGKVACILDAIGRQPYLGAGDSPGDHAMLSCSQHRLWIARHEKPRFQEATASLIRRTGKAGWMIQGSSAADVPRFLSGVQTA